MANTLEGALDWFGSPIGIAVTSVVSLVGLPLAVYGIFRTVSATKASKRAVLNTRRVLLTSELRQSVEATREISRRILLIEKSRIASASELRTLGNGWLHAQQRVFGLMRDHVTSAEAIAFRGAMLAATSEMQIAIDEAEKWSRWRRYDLTYLWGELHSYGEKAEALLRAADDEVLSA